MIKLAAIVTAGLILGGFETRHEVHVTPMAMTTNPTVVFDPKKDVMTNTGGGTYVTAGASGMVAPDVILGPGDYHQKRHSPSIFK